MVRTWRDDHPFRFFVIPGLALLVLTLVAAGVVGWHVYETGGIAGRVGTLGVSGMALFFAMQLIFIGMLSEMVGTRTK